MPAEHLPRTGAALGAILLLLAACGDHGGGDHGGGDHDGHDHGGGDHDGHDHGGGDHDGHDHGGGGHDGGDHDGGDHDGGDHDGHDHGGGDLDVPIEELLQRTCEHDMLTVDCDECRYEIGAVRVDPGLVEMALVSVGQVEQRHLDLPLRINATVGFNELRTVHVSPRAAGVVRSLAVDYGDVVTRGTTLLTVDSQELGEAAAAFLEASASLRLADATLHRQRELRDAGVTSERELLEARQAQESAAIRAGTARDRLLRMGLSAREVERLASGDNASMGILAVRAPQDGTVLDLDATPGELVEPGDHVALVGDLSTVWIWGDLYEEDLAAMAVAMADGPLDAVFETPAIPGRTFSGRADVLGSQLDPLTRTTRVRITVDNPEGLLRPGMFGTVGLRLGDSGSSLVVPSTAVCSDGDRDFVFVRIDGDLFMRRPVRLGRAGDGLVEVRGGVSAGQEVVTDGSFLLKSDVLREKMGAGCAH